MTPVCSVYSQLLQLFSCGQFAQIVRQHQAEFNAKGLTCWEQFVAILFCQMAHMNSLREVCLGLVGCESPLRHLGINAAPKRSTMAYANANRHGNSTSRFSCSCWKSVRPRRRRGVAANFVSRTNGSIADESGSSCQPPCSTGPSTTSARQPSSCICCWTATATYPRSRW
jgi:hypothetical protein